MVRTPLISALLLIFTHLAVFGQDTTLFEKRYFIEGDDTLRYRILLPEHYDSSKRYPLVLFLHGAGERGSDNAKQLVHGSKLFLDSLHRMRYPAIVLFPQCPTESYWASVLVDRTQSPLGLTFDYNFPMTRPMDLTLRLTQSFIATQKIKKDQVYVMGLSMGGMGTFEAVYRAPELFAAAVPICGGGDAKRYDRRIKKIPFWIFHGDVDAVVDVKHSRKMVDRLRELKAKVKYTEYKGVNHNSWDYAFAETELLSWLFRQRR